MLDREGVRINSFPSFWGTTTFQLVLLLRQSESFPGSYDEFEQTSFQGWRDSEILEQKREAWEHHSIQFVQG